MRWWRSPGPRARCWPPRRRRRTRPAGGGAGASAGGRARRRPDLPAAVVFDLDGVLVDTEERWTAAREALTRETGGTWTERATRDMMGMSAPEWSAYLRDDLGVPLSEQEINDEVVARLEASLREDL